MHEAPPVTASFSPQEYLLVFENFMTTTASAINDQLAWLTLAKPMLGSTAHAEYDKMLEAEIATNINSATSYIGYLAEQGYTVVVRSERGIHRLEALAYLVENGCYSAGIVTEEGQMLVPLDGASTLEIDEPSSTVRPWSAPSIGPLQLHGANDFRLQ
jgi:hypothetical protein